MNFDSNTLIGIFFFLFGSYLLTRNISFYFKPESLKKYIETSPKAALWRKKLGVEKTIKMAKTIFLPIGILVCIGFVVFGLQSGILPLISSL